MTITAVEAPTHLRKRDYVVSGLSIAEARDLVEQHHYAGGATNTRVFTHGLFHRDNLMEPLGVAWWLPPTKPAALSVTSEWRRVLSLTRLVVVPGMPTNAASFLLGQSIKLIKEDKRWTHLVTYADEGQGHTGAIYRATNWEYAGIRPGDPVYITPDGRHVARKAGGRTRTNAEMLELGYSNMGRTRKHKFVMQIRNANITQLGHQQNPTSQQGVPPAP